MQAVKILFKCISLTPNEQQDIVDFFTSQNSIDFHYYVIYDEKDRKNSVHCDINIWVVDKYDELHSDNYHCVIRFYTIKELIEEFETLIEEIHEVFLDEEQPSISIKQSLLSNTNTKKYNIDRRGKGELDVNYKAGSLEEDKEEVERRLKGSNTVISLNPYKDLFK